MPFEPGNDHHKKANLKRPKAITQKLIARLNDSEGAAMDRLITALLAKAYEGDTIAIREVFDRVEGKATQPISNDEDGAFVISWQARS